MIRVLTTCHAEVLDFRIRERVGGIGLIMQSSASGGTHKTGAGIWPTIGIARKIAGIIVGQLLGPKAAMIWAQATQIRASSGRDGLDGCFIRQNSLASLRGVKPERRKVGMHRRISRHLLIIFGFGFGIFNSAKAQSPHNASDLLHLSYLASGGYHWSAFAQAEISGDVNIGGIKGDFHEVVDLRRGRDATDIDADPIKMKQVSLTDSSWQADQSGLVTYLDTPSARADAINESYVDRNGWFAAKGSELSYVGTRKDHGVDYDLVKVTPPGGRSMTLWIDTTDHLLYRIDQMDATHHESDILYSNYRKLDGVMMPFSTRQSNGDPSQDTVMTVKRIQLSRTIDQAVFIPPPSMFMDARLVGGMGSATVPFSLADGRIVVDISLNGKPALPFLVDSGGSNVITPETAKLLGIEGSGDLASGGVGPAQDSEQLATVRTLRLGPVEMVNQQFSALPLPKFLQDRGGEAPIAGLVGAELLRRFPTTIDYQRKTLTFYKPGSTPPKPVGAQEVRLFFDGSHPYIQMDVDGVAGIFGIDTGDSSSATLFGPFYLVHEFPIEQPPQAREQGGIGGHTVALRTRVGSLSFGPWKLEDPLVTLNFADKGVFSNDSIAGNLGHELLKNFVFTLDYEHRRGYFLRSADFGKPLDYNRSGMALHRDKNGDVAVERVNPDTPAASAGMRPGDIILSIDGRNPRAQALSQFETVLSAAPGTKLEVRYSRAGKEMKSIIQLRELLPLGGTMSPFRTT